MNEITLERDYGWSADLSKQVYHLLVETKNAISEICCRPSQAGKASPVKMLAVYWNNHPSTSPKELEVVFDQFLSENSEISTSKSFKQLIEELKKQTRSQLEKTIPENQQKSFLDTSIDALLGMVSQNPLGDRLKEVLAGLPKVDESAVTNVGLPEPEDHGDKFKGLFCHQPFTYAQVDPLGELYPCCPQTLPESTGNLFDNDFMEVWNSSKAQAIRESIHDGSFKYCSESTCGVLQQKQLPKKESVAHPYFRDIIDKRITNLSRGPDTINMSYDRSCNLACPSCRTDIITLKGKAKQRAEIIHENVIDIKHLKDAKRLVITGSGDPFGSKLYHSFLRKFDPDTAPHLRITLSTNGLLLNEKTWGSICSSAIDRVELSVDGASTESYMANRGGDYNTLVDNLHFIGDLRERGELKVFELHYVVQKNNFHEMIDFVKLGKEVNADMICFKQIVNWGTYSESDYVNRAIQLPVHALHQVFINLLKDPIFRDPKVYMHDLSHLMKTTEMEAQVQEV